MALPKEPRQKMINFMYLVLTAMLALNVSTEILNAFKVVDTSLRNSSTTIQNSTNNSIAAIEDAKKDASMAEKAAIWKPIAEQANRLTQQMDAYIDALKDTLKRKSGYNPQAGDSTYKEDDLDTPTRMMDTEGKGKELYAKLQDFSKQIVEVIPVDKRAGLPTIPIDLTIPKSNNEASNKDWTTAYFHMTPTVAAITMLSKFQNDVKRSGNIVVDYCQQQLGKVVVVFDKFVPFTSQNSQYLLPGQPFELQAGLGAFSSKVKPTVTINGAAQQVNDDGYVQYNETAGGGGTRSFNVVVSFKDPNTGEMKTANKTVTYTVGQPSGASIFLEKMNVMYIGVDNPLTVSTGSAKREGMHVSIGGGSINSVGGDRYIARVSSPGNTTVNVTAEGKSFSFPIRVKYLPDPTAMVGTLKGGVISAAQFKAMGGVRAVLEGSEFDAQFSVVSYRIGANCGGTYNEAAVNGAQWGGNSVISSLKPGCLVWISNINARGPDGKNRKIPDLAFRLQ